MKRLAGSDEMHGVAGGDSLKGERFSIFGDGGHRLLNGAAGSDTLVLADGTKITLHLWAGAITASGLLFI